MKQNKFQKLIAKFAAINPFKKSLISLAIAVLLLAVVTLAWFAYSLPNAHIYGEVIGNPYGIDVKFQLHDDSVEGSVGNIIIPTIYPGEYYKVTITVTRPPSTDGLGLKYRVSIGGASGWLWDDETGELETAASPHLPALFMIALGNEPDSERITFKDLLDPSLEHKGIIGQDYPATEAETTIAFYIYMPEEYLVDGEPVEGFNINRFQRSVLKINNVFLLVITPT